MMVTCGTQFPHGGATRTYSVSLDEGDGVAILGEGFTALPWAKRREALEKLADIQVIEYLVAEEVLTREWANQRIAAVKAR